MSATTPSASMTAARSAESIWPDAFLDWQTQLLARLQAALPALPPALDDATVAAGLAALQAQLAALPALLQADWDARQPSRQLAATFSAQYLLLVFGKFNAGKSSLCNYLAARARRQGRAVAGFRFSSDGIEWHQQPFAEGATETTSVVQGIQIGDELVLIDTPGLHSASAANARTTQAVLQCADGMLWLTSSSAPGQVQELDDLLVELRRGKPLLPVITRSDLLEEDEVDGQIVSVRCNKPASTRQLQEQDVQERARARLELAAVDTGQLQTPLSLSVHAATLPGDPARIEAAAGLQRFDQALQQLRAHAGDYRARKQHEVIVHHLQEQVLGRLHTSVLPCVAALQDHLGNRRAQLPIAVLTVRRSLWKHAMLAVPGLLEQQDPSALWTQLDTLLIPLMREEVDEALRGFGLSLPSSLFHAPPVEITASDTLTDPGGQYQRQFQLVQSVVATALDEVLHDLQTQAAALLDGVAAPLDALAPTVAAAAETLQQLQRQLRGGG